MCKYKEQIAKMCAKKIDPAFSGSVQSEVIVFSPNVEDNALKQLKGEYGIGKDAKLVNNFNSLIFAIQANRPLEALLKLR